MSQKLLFISDSIPFPPYDGKRQRTLALLSAASKIFEVDFLVLGSTESEKHKRDFPQGFNLIYLPQESEKVWVKKLGVSFLPHPINQRRIKDFLRDKSYSKILCRYASSAKDLPNGISFVLDVDDDYLELMKTKIQQEKNPWRKLRFRQILALNRIFYESILKRATNLIWVKPSEISKKGILLPNLPFQLLLGNKPELVNPSHSRILFIGKLSYPPNSEGIRWFLEEVWMSLRKSLSSIELTLVSSVGPSSDLDGLIKSSPGVRLKINLENLEEAYRGHSLCIVPVFFGGGSNVKVSEALLMGRKVVSTPFGLRGFEPWENVGLIHVVKRPDEWVKKIQELLKETWSEDAFLEVRRDFSLEKWNQKLLRVLSEA